MEGLVDRELAQMGDLARDLTKLQELPEWDGLKKRFAEIRERTERAVVHDLLRSAEPIDQREVDYRRGYLKACEDFVLYPERLVAQYTKAMERKSEANG